MRLEIVEKITILENLWKFLSLILTFYPCSVLQFKK